MTLSVPMHNDYISFSDGTGIIYAVKNRKLDYVKQQVFHYHDAIVGERRFWDAQVAGITINRAVNVPYNTNVMQNDLIIINNQQYMVAQKDLKFTKPKSWLLSLRSNTIVYASGNES